MTEEKSTDLVKQFKNLIKEFSRIVRDNYTSRQGDEISTAEVTSKITDLYNNSPAEIRPELLFNVYHVLIGQTTSSSDDRWNSWLCTLANGLVTRLEQK